MLTNAQRAEERKNSGADITSVSIKTAENAPIYTGKEAVQNAEDQKDGTDTKATLNVPEKDAERFKVINI